MAPAEWHGSDLRIRATLVPRYLWTTASIDVVIDGATVLRTGGQLKAIGSTRREFRHGGAWHVAELAWGVLGSDGFPFTLRIDDELILASEVPVDNLLAVRIGWVSVLALLAAITFVGVRLLLLE